MVGDWKQRKWAGGERSRRSCLVLEAIQTSNYFKPNQRKWAKEEDWELVVWVGSWSSPTFLHHVFTNISSNCLGMYTATNYIQLTFLHCVFSGENGQREGEDWELSGFGSRRNVPAPIFRRLASPSPSVIHSTMQMAHCTPL